MKVVEQQAADPTARILGTRAINSQWSRPRIVSFGQNITGELRQIDGEWFFFATGHDPLNVDAAYRKSDEAAISLITRELLDEL